MSIADFSAALKANAYKDWFNRISTDSILKSSAGDLRKSAERDKTKNSFYISEKNIADVLTSITGSATPQQVSAVFATLKSKVYDRTKKVKQLSAEYDDSGKILYFPRVTFEMIRNALSEAFDPYLGGKKVSEEFQLGHVFGLFPKKLEIAIESLSKASTLDTKSKETLLAVLKEIEVELTKQDLETSNIKDPEFLLYARYAKSKDKYLVELQFKSSNMAAGRDQAPISVAVRKFFAPGKVAFNTKKEVVFKDNLVGDTFIKQLVETKGSPSMADLLVLSVKESLLGKRQSKKTYTISPVQIAKQKSKVDKSAVKKEIAADLQEVRKMRAALEASRVSRAEQPSTSLSQLLVILQTAINDKVAENMGNGSREDILNYRTGRFASSVEVQRLTISREGMISAFYTYMKYPYSTFSAGGEQQYPRTRDPKLLISQSMREIAAQIVTNNIRAVLV